MSLMTAYCRLCAQEVTSGNTIDLTEDTTLFQEICTELSMFNDINVKILFADHAPKIMCQTCNASLLVARQFIQKLRFTQQIYMGNTASSSVIDGLEVKVKASKRQFETKTNFLMPINGIKQEHVDSEQMMVPGDNSQLFEIEIKPDRSVEVLHTSQSNFNTNQDMSEPFIEIDSIGTANVNDGEKYNNNDQEGNLNDGEKDLPKPDEVEVCSSVKGANCSEGSRKKIIQFPKPQKDDSWSYFNWSCHRCNKVCSDLKMYREHCTSYHKVCSAFKCSECGENTDSFVIFIEHARKHREELRGYCHYCNFKFHKPEDEADHLAKHFDDNNKDCYSCGVIFPSREQLQSHMDTFNPPKPKWLPYLRPEKRLTIEDLTCPVCKKVTTTPRGLRKHMNRHTERTKDYSCEICGNAFYTKCALNAHRKTHSETNSEVCEICKQSFKTLRYLKEHIKVHSDERPFQCEVCSKAFKRKRQLEEHFRIHTNDMPFQCQYCLKAFRLKTNLKVHEHQHTGARPFSCTDCDRSFSNWTNCNKHMKRKHGKTLAKKALTAQGKLPLDPATGRPTQVDESLTANPNNLSSIHNLQI